VQGRASTIARDGGYHIRFDASDESSVLNIPTTELTAGEHIWLVSGDPATFARVEGVPVGRVFGPWNGTIDRKGDKISLWGYEGHKNSYFLVEKVNWKPKAPWPFPNQNDEYFALERMSLNTYANDPLNWKRRGSIIPCNPQNGASDCPWIDNCTLPYCSSSGACFYDSLACNSPFFASCYPNTICGGPVQDRKSQGDYPYGRTLRGCDLPNDPQFSMFGHGAEDVDSFGWYDVGGSSVFYWTATCRDVQIDCYVNAWNSWEQCQGGIQARTRTVRVNPLAGGKPCPPLRETRSCVQGALAVQGSEATFNSDSQTQGQTIIGLPAVPGIVVLVCIVISVISIAVGAFALVKIHAHNSRPETP